MIRALIVDVDGTLVDSIDLHAKSWQETFATQTSQIKNLVSSRRRLALPIGGRMWLADHVVGEQAISVGLN